MRKRASAATMSTPPIEPFLLDTETCAASRPWFVYLFALTDCSAFKVGFSCNPLQRICTFTRRYFERFDLSQSLLFELSHSELARELEAIVKTELAAHRAAAPAWLPIEAGGHTEWFSAVYFGEAEARLRACVAMHGYAQVASAFDHFRAQLEQVRAPFEAWAAAQGQRAYDAWASAQRGYMVRDEVSPLRDWLDAYRYFDLPLFVDEPRVLDLVRQSARLSFG
jgi:hypothetical protein